MTIVTGAEVDFDLFPQKSVDPSIGSLAGHRAENIVQIEMAAPEAQEAAISEKITYNPITVRRTF